MYTSAPPFLPPGTEAGNIGPLRCCLLHEVGGGTKKNDREVVTCRMNRILYRWISEARAKRENSGVKVVVHPARHGGESVA